MNKTKVKVLIFSGYGADVCTPKMQEIMEKYEGVESRVGEIIDYVENVAVPFDSFEDAGEVESNLRANIETIVSAENNKGLISTKYYLWDNELHSIKSFTIEEVDITRPWTIKDYDGSEYIRYLDERELVNEKLNYYK